MHVHILGICGTFMAGIAAIAREAGHRVTGADQSVYPPMSDQLRDLGIEIREGYDAAQLDLNPDVIVVGNVMTRGMPVIEALLDRRLPYMSGPEWLAAHVLRDQRVLAVTGTHGKTTTTSLLAWILECAGLEPGFLIGGMPADFDRSARLGGGDVFVIEADEYDTAFFDKRAKFLHYGPDTVIINNLEFDHADIYADLAAIQWQFHQLLRGLPGNGGLIVRAGDANIEQLLAMGCWTSPTGYSSDPDSGAEWVAQADGSQLRVSHRGKQVGAVEWPLRGSHNAENALAALLAGCRYGVTAERGIEAIGRFGGVRRRLEWLGAFGGVDLYDDFAHHPTAIRRTIAGLTAGDQSDRLLVVLEPRSNTMKMGVHRAELGAALAGADRAWVMRPEGLGWDLDAALADTAATVCDEVGAIVSAVAAEARAGDRVVVMSNGGFGGIHGLLGEALERRADRS